MEGKVRVWWSSIPGFFILMAAVGDGTQFCPPVWGSDETTAEFFRIVVLGLEN
jgi:hypothetical protein